MIKVRVDGVGQHAVAALTISAVNFHRVLSRYDFDREVDALARAAFAASLIEEIDIVAQEPIRVGKNIVVSGDYAQPAARYVFAVTVRRADLATLMDRLGSGHRLFITRDFRDRLAPSAS